MFRKLCLKFICYMLFWLFYVFDNYLKLFSGFISTELDLKYQSHKNSIKQNNMIIHVLMRKSTTCIVQTLILYY